MINLSEIFTNTLVDGDNSDENRDGTFISNIHAENIPILTEFHRINQAIYDYYIKYTVEFYNRYNLIQLGKGVTTVMNLMSHIENDPMTSRISYYNDYMYLQKYMCDNPTFFASVVPEIHKSKELPIKFKPRNISNVISVLNYNDYVVISGLKEIEIGGKTVREPAFSTIPKQFIECEDDARFHIVEMYVKGAFLTALDSQIDIINKDIERQRKVIEQYEEKLQILQDICHKIS